MNMQALLDQHTNSDEGWAKITTAMTRPLQIRLEYANNWARLLGVKDKDAKPGPIHWTNKATASFPVQNGLSVKAMDDGEKTLRELLMKQITEDVRSRLPTSSDITWDDFVQAERREARIKPDGVMLMHARLYATIRKFCSADLDIVTAVELLRTGLMAELWGRHVIASRTMASWECLVSKWGSTLWLDCGIPIIYKQGNQIVAEIEYEFSMDLDSIRRYTVISSPDRS